MTQVVEILPHVRQELTYWVIIMGANALVMQGARASATMVLTIWKQNNTVPAR